MVIALWIVAGLALLLAWSARSRLSSVQESVDAARRDSSIRQGDLEELKASLDGLRKLVAMQVGGKPVDAEMVKENRLFRNTNTAALQAEFEAGENPYVIDVRTVGEWAGGHIPGAVHIPLDKLTDELHQIARDGRAIYITCASGGRSAQAADYLSGRGYLNVFNVEGGMSGWRGDVERA
jgi:rhodanese-related sulfurtransferase